MSASVAWITIAPVKGLALSPVDDVLLEELGVRENRRFHLVDAEGNLTNGKRLGKLALVRAEYDDSASTLALHFPDGETVSAPVETEGAVTTDFYGRPVGGREVRGPFAGALSAYAGRELRLVRSDEAGAGVDRGRWGAVSLVSTAALEAIARAGGADAPLDGRRFRMLFGLDGVGAHEEDGWLGKRVRIGDAVVELRNHVGRCAVTKQNPQTGEPDFDTLKSIGLYRANVASVEPLPFGVWGGVVEPGRVRVGDDVTPE